MRALKLSSLYIGLWWKKFDKLTLAYLPIFLILYFSAASNWATGKPKALAAEILKRTISIDFSQSYNGLELMGWYFWLLLLPLLFSVLLFNRIVVFVLYFFIIVILMLKIYDSYIDLDSNIPFKDYIMPHITVDVHAELYMFFIVLSLSFLFSFVNIFLPKKSKIRA